MKCDTLIHQLDQLAPERLALDWDHVGLQAGRREKEVSSVYIALDATETVIEEAVAAGADMLITHHPMIFKPRYEINTDDFIGRRLVRLLQQDISYYAMHTNFDLAKMSDLAAEQIFLQDAQVLDFVIEEQGYCYGIGKVGFLAEQLLSECVELVKQSFSLPQVKVFGNLDQKIKRVAISPGSGKSEIGCALEKKAQVLITGDIDHHSGIDAVAQGLNIIDAGHYGIEHIFIAYMEAYLKEQFPELKIYTAERKLPFQII